MYIQYPRRKMLLYLTIITILYYIYIILLQIVVHKQLSRVGIKLATFGLLEKRLDLSPREVRCF